MLTTAVVAEILPPAQKKVNANAVAERRPQRLQYRLFRVTFLRHLRVLLVGSEGHASSRLLNLFLAHFSGLGSTNAVAPGPGDHDSEKAAFQAVDGELRCVAS